MSALAHIGKSAFYSSVVNAIILNPKHMIIPIDDKIIGRGYATHISVHYTNNHFYRLPQALDSFYQAATLFNLTPPYTMQDTQGTLIIRNTQSAYSKRWN